MTILIKHWIALLISMIIGLKCTCESCDNDADTTDPINTTPTCDLEGRIVGSHVTEISKFPHSAALVIYPDKSYFCGGSFLNQIIILTAAHCTPDKYFKNPKRAKNKMAIMAGHEELEKMETIRFVAEYVYHAEFVADTLENDIALLFLENAVTFGKDIKRIIVPKVFPSDVNYAYIAGWGTINDETKEMSTILKFAPQKVFPLEVCSTKYEDDWLPGTLCAGDPEAKADSPSKGDSGSALVASEYLQIGVVSYRYLGHPGLVFYSNVTYFYEWIETTTISYLSTCLSIK